jgi:hypothetical protein
VNPVAGAMLTPAGLWLIIAGIAVSEVRKALRDRRLDREARERRDRQIAASIADVCPADVAQLLSPAEGDR